MSSEASALPGVATASHDIAWADARMRPGLAAVLAVAVLYVAFFPKALANGDEYYYAGQAYVLARGRLVPVAGDPLPVIKGREGDALRFPVGWPLALSLARLGGFRAMYLVPMFLHLAAGVAFARLLVRRQLPAWANVAYLFHPAIWGLSRTLMSDVPAVALLVVAVDAWEARRSWFPGTLLAYGMLMRLGGVLTGVGFGLAALGDLRREPRRLTGLVLPMALVAGIHLAVNQLVAGHATATPYVQGTLTLLDGSRLDQHLLLYAAGLAVMPPFSLAALLLGVRHADRWCLGAIPVLAFFLPYAYHDESRRLIETLVGGQRLVLAAHVFLMIGMVRAWGSLVTARLRLPVIGAGLAMAVMAALGLDHIRAGYDDVSEALSACGPERVGYDHGSGRVVAGLDAKRWRLLDGSDPMGQDDLVVVSPTPVTNRPPDPKARFSYPELDRYLDRCMVVGRFEVYDLTARCRSLGYRCGG